jgi:hypothetical protein
MRAYLESTLVKVGVGLLIVGAAPLISSSPPPRSAYGPIPTPIQSVPAYYSFSHSGPQSFASSRE